MLILIRGAGDLASGVALRLHRSGLKVVMTDLERPTAIRRTVCFSQAILFGKAKVEDVTAVRAETMDDVRRILAAGNIPVLAIRRRTAAMDCGPMCWWTRFWRRKILGRRSMMRRS